MSNSKNNEYNKEYKKKNYRTIGLHMSFVDANELDNHVKVTGEKRAAFIKRAVIETVEEETGDLFEDVTES